MGDLISRSALIKELMGCTCTDKHDELIIKRFVGDMVRSFSTVDAVPVVRCKDCKHRVEPSKMCMHPKAIGWDAIEPEDDDFCSYGEKKEVQE